jgi:hypothetical protein
MSEVQLELLHLARGVGTVPDEAVGVEAPCTLQAQALHTKHLLSNCMDSNRLFFDTISCKRTISTAV